MPDYVRLFPVLSLAWGKQEAQVYMSPATSVNRSEGRNVGVREARLDAWAESFWMAYMGLVRSSTCVRALALLGMTAFFLVAAAILLPPEGSNAMPRKTPAVGSR